MRRQYCAISRSGFDTHQSAIRPIGYFIASLTRNAQALEPRPTIDDILIGDPERCVAVAGDFNAEDHDTPVRLTIGAEEDTGDGELAALSLFALNRAIRVDRRWSVLHHGRPPILDHILASRALWGHFRQIDVYNETLGDEAVGFAKTSHSPASYHAPVVAGFASGDATSKGLFDNGQSGREFSYI